MNLWWFLLGVHVGFGGAVIIASILPRKANAPPARPKA